MLRASSAQAGRSVPCRQGKFADLNAFISQALTHRNGVPLFETDDQRGLYILGHMPGSLY